MTSGLRAVTFLFIAALLSPAAASSQTQTAFVVLKVVSATGNDLVTVLLPSGRSITFAPTDVDQALTDVLVRALTAQPQAASAPAPTPPDFGPTIHIGSMDYRITEQNSVFWRFAWQSSIRNGSEEPRVFTIEIEYQDADGFILDTATEYRQVLRPWETKTFTGSSLLGVDIAPRVRRVVIRTR